MAEALGLAASIIQVAGTGLSVSKALYEYVDGVATADRRIRKIAQEIEFTSVVIEELGGIFQHDETKKIISKNAVKTANQTMEECSSIFAEIEATLKKSKRNTFGRLMLPFRDHKIELLRSHIDKLKSSLQLLISVLNHAHQLALKSDREAERKQREEIKELLESQKRSTKKYEESLVAFSISDGSATLNDDLEKDEEEEENQFALSARTSFNEDVEKNREKEVPVSVCSFIPENEVSVKGFTPKNDVSVSASNLKPENDIPVSVCSFIPENDISASASTLVPLAKTVSSSLSAETLANCVQHVKSLLRDVEALQQAFADQVDGDHDKHHSTVHVSYNAARIQLESMLFGMSTEELEFEAAKQASRQANDSKNKADNVVSASVSRSSTLLDEEILGTKKSKKKNKKRKAISVTNEPTAEEMTDQDNVEIETETMAEPAEATTMLEPLFEVEIPSIKSKKDKKKKRLIRDVSNDPEVEAIAEKDNMEIEMDAEAEPSKATKNLEANQLDSIKEENAAEYKSSITEDEDSDSFVSADEGDVEPSTAQLAPQLVKYDEKKIEKTRYDEKEAASIDSETLTEIYRSAAAMVHEQGEQLDILDDGSGGPALSNHVNLRSQPQGLWSSIFGWLTNPFKAREELSMEEDSHPGSNEVENMPSSVEETKMTETAPQQPGDLVPPTKTDMSESTPSRVDLAESAPAAAEEFTESELLIQALKAEVKALKDAQSIARSYEDRVASEEHILELGADVEDLNKWEPRASKKGKKGKKAKSIKREKDIIPQGESDTRNEVQLAIEHGRKQHREDEEFQATNLDSSIFHSPPSTITAQALQAAFDAVIASESQHYQQPNQPHQHISTLSSQDNSSQNLIQQPHIHPQTHVPVSSPISFQLAGASPPPDEQDLVNYDPSSTIFSEYATGKQLSTKRSHSSDLDKSKSSFTTTGEVIDGIAISTANGSGHDLTSTIETDEMEEDKSVGITRDDSDEEDSDEDFAIMKSRLKKKQEERRRKIRENRAAETQTTTESTQTTTESTLTTTRSTRTMTRSTLSVVLEEEEDGGDYLIDFDNERDFPDLLSKPEDNIASDTGVGSNKRERGIDWNSIAAGWKEMERDREMKALREELERERILEELEKERNQKIAKEKLEQDREEERRTIIAENRAKMVGERAPSDSGNHALQNYEMQLMLLEQQNKKRLLMVRQEQDNISGPYPTPPQDHGTLPSASADHRNMPLYHPGTPIAHHMVPKSYSNEHYSQGTAIVRPENRPTSSTAHRRPISYAGESDSPYWRRGMLFPFQEISNLEQKMEGKEQQVHQDKTMHRKNMKPLALANQAEAEEEGSFANEEERPLAKLEEQMAQDPKLKDELDQLAFPMESLREKCRMDPEDAIKSNEFSEPSDSKAYQPSKVKTKELSDVQTSNFNVVTLELSKVAQDSFDNEIYVLDQFKKSSPPKRTTDQSTLPFRCHSDSVGSLPDTTATITSQSRSQTHDNDKSPAVQDSEGGQKQPATWDEMLDMITASWNTVGSTNTGDMPPRNLNGEAESEVGVAKGEDKVEDDLLYLPSSPSHEGDPETIEAGTREAVKSDLDFDYEEEEDLAFDIGEDDDDKIDPRLLPSRYSSMRIVKDRYKNADADADTAPLVPLPSSDERQSSMLQENETETKIEVGKGEDKAEDDLLHLPSSPPTLVEITEEVEMGRDTCLVESFDFDCVGNLDLGDEDGKDFNFDFYSHGNEDQSLRPHNSVGKEADKEKDEEREISRLLLPSRENTEPEPIKRNRNRNKFIDVEAEYDDDDDDDDDDDEDFRFGFDDDDDNDGCASPPQHASMGGEVGKDGDGDGDVTPRLLRDKREEDDGDGDEVDDLLREWTTLLG